MFTLCPLYFQQQQLAVRSALEGRGVCFRWDVVVFQGSLLKCTRAVTHSVMSYSISVFSKQNLRRTLPPVSLQPV